MPYDLIIKNGMVIDGTGFPRYRADVAVRHGRIAAIGRMRESARAVVDADGQVFWEVRARQALALEQAVRMLSFEPATHWGCAHRGLIREGMAADLLVFDPDTIAPEMPEVVRDLPARARRLTQRARAMAATVVNGEVVVRDGKPTGACRGSCAAGARDTRREQPRRSTR